MHTATTKATAGRRSSERSPTTTACTPTPHSWPPFGKTSEPSDERPSGIGHGNADIDANALGFVVFQSAAVYFVDASKWTRFETDYRLGAVGNLELSNLRVLASRDSNAASVLTRPLARALVASVVHLGSLEPRVRSAAAAHLHDAHANLDAAPLD